LWAGLAVIFRNPGGRLGVFGFFARRPPSLAFNFGLQLFAALFQTRFFLEAGFLGARLIVCGLGFQRVAPRRQVRLKNGALNAVEAFGLFIRLRRQPRETLARFAPARGDPLLDGGIDRLVAGDVFLFEKPRRREAARGLAPARRQGDHRQRQICFCTHQALIL